MNFKPGDKIRCINNSRMETCLEVGQVYTVIEIEDSDPDLVVIRGDKLPRGTFVDYRFELVENPTDNSPVELKIYYSDSAAPIILKDVVTFFTEGNLLRIIREEKEVFIPLCGIHRLETKRL